MKPHFPNLCLLLIVAYQCSCVANWDLIEVAEHIHDSRHASPEAEWNGCRIWKRVSEKPATYVPAAYGTTSPRSAADGEWIHDKRDGKRFFVPQGGAGGLSESVIRKDAIKNSGAHPVSPTIVPGILVM